MNSELIRENVAKRGKTNPRETRVVKKMQQLVLTRLLVGRQMSVFVLIG